MSTIAITFNTQALDFSPLNRGVVSVVFNDGTRDLNLNLTLTTSISTSGKFQEVAWIDGVSGEDDQQAVNFAQAFNRDFKNIGGTKNIAASVLNNVVTLTATTGTFPDAQSSYSGNVLMVAFGTPNNDPVIPILNLIVTRTTNGDCDNIEYSATTTGGTPNYTLYEGSNVLQSNWDGSAFSFNLSRTAVSTSIRVVDSNSLEDISTQIIPRKLKEGEFSINETQFESSSDITVSNTNPVNGTTPIEYSLDATTESTGTNYQSGNAFAGILPGTYRLFIRDIYGCEIFKTITINELQDPTSDSFDFFQVVNAQSVPFAEFPTFNSSIKKNFENTLSWNELTGVNYEIRELFIEGDDPRIQFKSSFDWNRATMYRCNQSSIELTINQIANNLGTQEKVDCKLFELDGQTAIYFDGGNQYEPNTTTVIDSSEYINFAPEWAEEGNIVTIDTLGSFTIVATGYDSTLGKSYSLIDTVTSLTDGLIQATFNKHPYNTYEFVVPINLINTTARIVLEYGNSSTEIIGNPFVSELIQKTEEEQELLIEASSTKNRADIVFQSEISFLCRKDGVFRPLFEGDVENYDGDSRIYPLTENLYQRYRLELDWITAKQAYRFAVWCLLDGFKVNNVPLRATKFPEIQPNGHSNFYSFKVDLGLNGDIMDIQANEEVINIDTGLVGRSLNEELIYDGRTRLVINGGFVTVGGNYIAV